MRGRERGDAIEDRSAGLAARAGRRQGDYAGAADLANASAAKRSSCGGSSGALNLPGNRTPG
jgi:hypothetical protein